MATKHEGFYSYEEEDIVGTCAKHGGDLVRDHDFADLMDLTKAQRFDLEVGLWDIRFCPRGFHVEVVYPLPVEPFSRA